MPVEFSKPYSCRFPTEIEAWVLKHQSHPGEAFSSILNGVLWEAKMQEDAAAHKKQLSDKQKTGKLRK